jgi:hypothetical protein
MTIRTLVLTTFFVAAASGVHAQPAAPRTPTPPREPATLQTPAAPRAATPATPAVAPVAPVPPVARRMGQPINIKIELTITDQRGGAAPVKKTVTVVTGDGLNGSLRSTANFSFIGDVPLNVDAEPSIQADGKIRLSFSLQYDLPSQVPPESRTANQLQRTNIRESMNVILESGKSLTVAQAADPISDRQVTVEVMATVLK